VIRQRSVDVLPGCELLAVGIALLCAAGCGEALGPAPAPDRGITLVDGGGVDSGAVFDAAPRLDVGGAIDAGTSADLPAEQPATVVLSITGMT